MMAIAATGRTHGQLWRGWIVVLALLGFAFGPISAHPKTDVIVLENGDRLQGEIKTLQNGMLSVGTDAAGTVHLKWTHVEKVTSTYDYQVELTGGSRYYGALAETEKAGELKIVGPSETLTLPKAEIVAITPIEHGFWKKLKGSINLGLSYTQSNQALQYSFNGDAHFRTRKRFDNLQWSSIFNTQAEGDTANQQSVSFRHTRFLKHKLSAFALGQLQSNPDQGFDLRSNLGGGAGWSIVRNVGEELIGTGGLVYVREEVEGSTRVDNSAAVMLGINFASFSYDQPKRTVTLGLNTFTNVTDRPRFRVQLNFKLSWEVVNNFDVSLNVLESYDTRPPTVGAANNDMSVVTSLGYSF